MMTHCHSKPTTGNPNTQEQSAQTEPRKPSLNEIIAKAQLRAAPEAHGTTPPADHISIPGRNNPNEGRDRDH